jgi:glycosyltransferase involved in cell wall biosynthesis
MRVEKSDLTILQQRARNILSQGNDFRKQTKLEEVPRKTTFRVSAIVSTYNSERFISGCLKDLVCQTLYQKGQLEVIVINSGSEQGEGAIVEDYQRRYRNIRHIRLEARETIYAAWNRGIATARGQFITNANTDDRHRVDALERMAQVLDSRPEVVLVYADCAITEKENQTFESTQPVAHFRWPDFDRGLLFEVCYVGPQPMWRRDLHERYGYFDSEFRSAGDYEFWLRIAGREQFLHVADVLGLYLLSPSGVERGDNSLSFRESEIARDRYWPGNSGKRPPARGCFLVPVASAPAPGLPEERRPQRLTVDGAEDEPRVSVIVPTYNRPEKLVEALKSILNQTYQNFEVIVVNDCGTDVGSLISFLDEKHQITYLRHDRNRDRSAARNSGIRLARGKYIGYLDDDDVFYPDHLETLVSFLETTGYKVAYSDAYRVHQVKENGRDISKEKDQPYSRDFDRDQILINNFIPTLCLMHERSCLDEVGTFDEGLATHEDWDLWIRLSRRYHFGHIKKLTCEFSWRTDGTSTTSQKQSDFLRTMQIIYARYCHYVGDKPHIIQAQEANRKILQERVSRPELISVQDAPSARDQSLRAEAGLASRSQPEISRVMERVNRYLSLGKLELARRIVQKELGHLKECSEILLTIGQLESSAVVSQAAK